MWFLRAVTALRLRSSSQNRWRFNHYFWTGPAPSFSVFIRKSRRIFPNFLWFFLMKNLHFVTFLSTSPSKVWGGTIWRVDGWGVKILNIHCTSASKEEVTNLNHFKKLIAHFQVYFPVQKAVVMPSQPAQAPAAPKWFFGSSPFFLFEKVSDSGCAQFNSTHHLASHSSDNLQKTEALCFKCSCFL